MIDELSLLIAKLTVTDLIGLCQILKIQIYKNKGETIGELKFKDFDEILEEILQKFSSLGKKQKKQIIKLLKQVEKANKIEERKKNENENL